MSDVLCDAVEAEQLRLEAIATASLMFVVEAEERRSLLRCWCSELAAVVVVGLEEDEGRGLEAVAEDIVFTLMLTLKEGKFR
jgi:hypothetical protein